MKNLKEIWSGVRLDAIEIKEAYYAELLSIGVHGRTRLAVKLIDVNQEFYYGSLKGLYVSENETDYRVRSFVKFTEKNKETGEEESKYVVRIEHGKDKDNFKFTLTAGGLKYVNHPHPEITEHDSFELTVEELGRVTTWNEILSKFSSLS